eukprot:COSAG01_NODE_8545_length_2747_cov_15.717498_1_plen_157_part_10
MMTDLLHDPGMLSARAQRALRLSQGQRSRGVRPPPASERADRQRSLATAGRFGKSFASPRDVRTKARRESHVSSPPRGAAGRRFHHRFKVEPVGVHPKPGETAGQTDFWLRRGTALPRDFKHIRPRTPDKKAEVVVEEEEVKDFGSGDIVRLKNAAR